MNLLINAINTYKEIIDDFSRPENKLATHLNRSILLVNKIRILYVVMSEYKQRIIAVMLPNNYDSSVVERFPKWHGIDTHIGNTKSYFNENDESQYVIIRQSREYDSSIFEIIANDISVELNKIPSSELVVKCLYATLQKWKRFFEINNIVIMPEKLQQGLYGELLVLKKMLPIWGKDSVKYWCGAERETHDFYINGNAIEVKTLSSNSNENVTISNEYQLDTSDVENELYLYVNLIRRSHSDGETLPQIISSIQESLDNDTKELFEEKLFNYGYISSCSEKYKFGFFIRTQKCYYVSANFPCITKETAMFGISNISYAVDLNACEEFKTEWNEIVNKINEVN